MIRRAWVSAVVLVLASAVSGAQTAPANPTARPGDGPVRLELPSPPQASIAAEARVREMETLARLSADGQALYEADDNKKSGYDYCHVSQSLASAGEFRLAVREASKALFLGQQQKNDDMIAWAKRDLAIAYSYAGNLDRAQQYATEALTHLARPQNRPIIHAVAYKTLGDVALRRGDTRAAIDWYEKSYGTNEGAMRFLARLGVANAHIAAGDFGKAESAIKNAETYLDVLTASAPSQCRSNTRAHQG
jgi:tetratricopeptide (TPR) repeat protein